MRESLPGTRYKGESGPKKVVLLTNADFAPSCCCTSKLILYGVGTVEPNARNHMLVQKFLNTVYDLSSKLGQPSCLLSSGCVIQKSLTLLRDQTRT